MSDLTCKPNFFVVGAPKSGTTSLHMYLAQHPDIFMSSPKEPFYLAPDLTTPDYPQTDEEYLRYFQGYNGERRVGESTIFYLYSKMAARTIQEFAPNSKIIAMLRNPVDMVTSLHAQHLKVGVEDILRLQDALEAETDRRQGKRIPKGIRMAKECLLYRDIATYTEQLERYFSVIGRDNVHIVIFDDFKRDTASEFAKVCRFLGVSPDFKPEMLVHNPAQTPRSFRFHRAFSRLTPVVVGIGERLRPIIPNRLLKLTWRIYSIPRNLNLKVGPPVTDAETQQALIAYFKQEIRDLEILLKRDLSCWRINDSVDLARDE